MTNSYLATVIIMVNYAFLCICKQQTVQIIKLTFSVQSELTSRLPGLMSRCRMLAECRYFKPSNHRKKISNTSEMSQETSSNVTDGLETLRKHRM